MRIRQILSLALLCATSVGLYAQRDYTQYVNPNIGVTHSRWFFYTPAAMPFGLAKLGPSTNGTYGNKQGWEAVGYQDDHRTIDGFPCLHEFQIGGIALMPVTGNVLTVSGKVEDAASGFRGTMDKGSEVSQPGYYSIRLSDYNVKAELTATKRVGLQRFTFGKSADAHILFNIGSRQGESGEVLDANIRQVSKHEIEGYVITKPQYVKNYQPDAVVPMYFHAWVSKVPRGVRVFHIGGSMEKGNCINGVGAVMCLDYATKEGEQITVKVGLSYKSVDNARLNYEAEARSVDFDRAHADAHKTWNEYLGRIDVKDSSSDNLKKFYTGLFHALLGRGLASDVNGAYPKNDGTVGQIELCPDGTPKHNHYNTDAIWGTYWNLTNLWALAYPDYYNDFINSQLLVFKDAGWLGDGIAASRFVSGVGTNMMPVVFAGAYNSGIRNYDVDLAYRAAWKNEMCGENRPEGAGKTDVGLFVKLGYVPYNDSVPYGTHDKGSAFCASHTLEYSFSTYALSQWAKAMGKTADYRRLIDLSNGWTHIFDDSLKLIHPRGTDGRFIDKFNPLEPWRGFQEGNAVQYTFFVPQNPTLLVEKMGRERFNQILDSIFIVSRKSIFAGGTTSEAFAGLENLYNHGNQPCLHESWLFNFSGCPWLTQKWTHIICDEFYGTDGEHGYGYGQDEDQGQLGAWYVMSSLGLFDVQGGSPVRPTFQIGSPMFDEVTIKLNPMNATGKTFTIHTHKTGTTPYYVQSATLDGQPLNQCWIYRDQLYKGGGLDLRMDDEPNTNWGMDSTPYCPQ